MLARLRPRLPCRARLLHTTPALHASTQLYDPDSEPREEELVDVCIVGGGPAGLSAAIRLKQLEAETGKDVRVVVLEKGGEVGAHILSGARLAAWLGGVAEGMGAEIYPGFAGRGCKRGGEERKGVITHDAGLTRQRTKSARFEPGVAFARGAATLLAEGAHGSLSKQAIAMYGLREGKEAQTYGIGVKEVWRVSRRIIRRVRKVLHTLGWPLDNSTYGGGWEYHMADGLVSIGLVVGLDYKNPWVEPYQRMKHHPHFRSLLSNGSAERLAYGARALTEGGLQSLPRLDFPGGAVIGCSAGVVNTAKIKGTHNAMRTGMLAAEAAFAALHPSAVFVSTASPETFKVTSTVEEGEGSASTDAPLSLTAYTTAFRNSPAYNDLWAVRNVRPAFNTRLGVFGGVMYAGVDTMLRGRVPWTLRHHKRDGTNPSTTSPDALATLPASACKPIEYPQFEPPLSTDLMSSVALTGTNHGEGEAVHLRGENAEEDVDVQETPARRRAHVQANVGTYAGLLQRACPAGVYEYVPDDEGKVVPGNAGVDGEAEGWEGTKLVINSQNCIHCKLCDIKVPTQDITWTVPEGGGGPKYKANLRGRQKLPEDMGPDSCLSVSNPSIGCFSFNN
ncbi:FAD/NAD(P)-binding domain-containing protein [Mycena leptocephala]|nr:FAD/NAD(P)-binding domain-containing protein [Mycena leptocephala]